MLDSLLQIVSSWVEQKPAMKNNPISSLVDGFGNNLGYAVVLIFVAFFRELFGSGTILGKTILPLQKMGVGINLMV